MYEIQRRLDTLEERCQSFEEFAERIEKQLLTRLNSKKIKISPPSGTPGSSDEQPRVSDR